MSNNVIEFTGKETESENLPDGRALTTFTVALHFLLAGKAMRRRAWEPSIQFAFYQNSHEIRLGDVIDMRVLLGHLPNPDIGIKFQSEFMVLELFRHVRTITFTTRDILAKDWYEVFPDEAVS